MQNNNSSERILKQKNRIELIEQKQNLSQEYFDKAENELKAVNALEGNKEWQENGFAFE